MAVFKLGLVADEHYGSTEPFVYPNGQRRTQALTRLDRFKTRMAAFGPSLVASLGDHSTALDASEKTSLLSAVIAKLGEIPTFSVATTGNHDFEYATATEVRAVLAGAGLTHFEAGKLYGSFDVGDWHVVVLDGNYKATTPFAHFTAGGDANTGAGYIPDGTDGSDNQLGWLTADLAATTKRTLIFCHQLLEEVDGSTFYMSPTSDFGRYSVANRAAVRAVLEASGKVAAVFGGHQHFSRVCTIRGIPYIAVPSLASDVLYPTRHVAGDGGAWSEVTIDDTTGAIDYDVWEDDSIAGSQKVVTRRLYLPDFESPFRMYARGWSAGIGAGATGNTSYDSGELTHWTVTTDTVDMMPVDLLLAQATIAQGGGLVVKGGTTAKAGKAVRRVAPQSGQFRFGVSIEKAETNKTFHIRLQNSAGTVGPSLTFGATGNILCGATVLGNYLAGARQDITFVVDVATDTFDVLVNGATLGTAQPFVSSLASVDRMEMEWPAGQDGTVYLREMRVYDAAVTAQTFEYEVPIALYSATPNHAYAVGGVEVTLTGINFTLAQPTVTFGGIEATNVVVVNNTTITCTVPAHAVGVVDIVVTIDGASATLVGGFTYAANLAIASIAPARGDIAGGTRVVVEGEGFLEGVPVVLFDGVPATDVDVVDAQHLACTVPAHVFGWVDVEVDVGTFNVAMVNSFAYVRSVSFKVRARSRATRLFSDFSNEVVYTVVPPSP